MYFLFHSQPLLADMPELKRRKMKEKNERQRWGKSAELRRGSQTPSMGLEEARAQTERKLSQRGKGLERR